MHNCRRLLFLMACALSALMIASPLPAADMKRSEQWRILNARVVALLSYGQLETALPLARRAVELAEQSGSPEYTMLSDSLHNLAEIYHRQYQYAQAELLYKRALDIKERAGAPEYPEITRELDGLGKQYFGRRNYAAAEEIYRRSLAIKQKSFPADSIVVRVALGNLALVLESMNNQAEAASLLEIALAAKADRDSVDLMMLLARIREKQNRISEAEAMYVKALWETRDFGGRRLWKQALVHYGAATFYERQGKFEESERLLEKALSADARMYGRNSIVLERHLVHLANIYRKLNKDKKTAAAEVRRQQILAGNQAELSRYFREHADKHSAVDEVTLIVSAYVEDEGSVHAPEVVLSSGKSAVDEDALTYMRREKFNPIVLFGVAIGHRQTYRVAFRRSTTDASYAMAKLEDLSTVPFLE